MKNPTLTSFAVIVLFLTACGEYAPEQPLAAPLPACDADNGGITLQDGFCAFVVADDLGRARHLTVADNGDIYVRFRRAEDAERGVAVLRDTDGDGRADVQEWFADDSGTGIELHNGYLYVSTDHSVMRYQLAEGELKPQEPPETIIEELRPGSGVTTRQQRSHAAKPFAFDESGSIYVTVGAPSNNCQEEEQVEGSPGMNPCPLLEQHGGIWRFDADETGQSQEEDGHRYSTGIRHAVAIAWNPVSKGVYALQHGRDKLDSLWPKYFNAEQDAEIPSEEFLRLEDGANFGWPYCYHDPIQGKKVLAPEYGGDGEEVGGCDQYGQPLLAFPGHYAPNDLLFYTGSQFPERYRGAAFVAFHGSGQRTPLPEAGYEVSVAPTGPDGKPSSDDEWETFADGFAGQTPLASRRDARFRAMGLAQGPDGSLYISDSVKGRIWRVIYTGTD